MPHPSQSFMAGLRVSEITVPISSTIPENTRSGARRGAAMRGATSADDHRAAERTASQHRIVARVTEECRIRGSFEVSAIFRRRRRCQRR
jgi:hypothetical protein